MSLAKALNFASSIFAWTDRTCFPGLFPLSHDSLRDYCLIVDEAELADLYFRRHIKAAFIGELRLFSLVLHAPRLEVFEILILGKPPNKFPSLWPAIPIQSATATQVPAETRATHTPQQSQEEP